MAHVPSIAPASEKTETWISTNRRCDDWFCTTIATGGLTVVCHSALWAAATGSRTASAATSTADFTKSALFMGSSLSVMLFCRANATAGRRPGVAAAAQAHRARYFLSGVTSTFIDLNTSPHT